MNRTTRLKKPQIPELDTLYQFDDLGGRPKYGGVEMTSATDIPSFEEIQRHVDGAITAEAAARSAADDDLEEAIDAVEGGLEDEIAAREAADQAEATARAAADQAETTARTSADNNLQTQIDAIVASSDVKDIVGTKAELNNYDTSTLGNNDIIKVLQDESENNATTYYRWNATTQQFTLIGEEGPYYTKAATDALLNAKQNTLTAGSNVQIVNDTISATDTTYTAGTGLALNGTQFSVDTTAIATQSDLTAGLANKQDTLTAGANIQINNNTISATDTTYSNFTGTDGVDPGTAGLVPAPATTDAGKFLKADGTWDTAGGSSVTVVQATGTSTADVMSQNAVTSMICNDPANMTQIRIGKNALASTSHESVGIGYNGKGTSYGSIGIMGESDGNSAIAIGVASQAAYRGSVALGSKSRTSQQGEMNIGTSDTSIGYNNSNYRLISGLYDPQSDHDAATKGYVDTAVAGAGASYYSNSELESLWEGGV